jgi:hypothetical protein
MREDCVGRWPQQGPATSHVDGVRCHGAVWWIVVAAAVASVVRLRTDDRLRSYDTFAPYCQVLLANLPRIAQRFTPPDPLTR